jgi:hypothetical protein
MAFFATLGFTNIRRSWWGVRLGLLLIGCMVMVGCASVPPQAPIDQAKLAAIRSIAIAIPEHPAVSASVGAAQGANSGPSMTSAVITGAMTGFMNGYAQANAAGFNDLVKQRLPSLDFGRDLAEAFAQELSKKGYQTQLYRPDGNSGGSDNDRPAGKTDAPNDAPIADALLILVPTVGYQAPGPLNAYTRRVVLSVMLLDGKTRANILYRGFIYRRHFSDDYSYNTYGSLTDHLPEAVDGLRKALLEFAPQLGALLPHRSGGAT